MNALGVIQKIDKLAEKALRKTKRIDQTIFLLTRDSLHVCDVREFFTTDADKRGAKGRLMDHVREYARQNNIEPDATCAIYQAWMSPDLSESPSSHPEKERVLVYCAEAKLRDGTTEKLVGTRLIDKLPNGHVILGKFEARRSLAAFTTFGFGFFDEPKTHSDEGEKS